MKVTYRESVSNIVIEVVEVKKVDFVEMANGEIKVEFIGIGGKRGGWSYYSVSTNQIVSIKNN